MYAEESIVSAEEMNYFDDLFFLDTCGVKVNSSLRKLSPDNLRELLTVTKDVFDTGLPNFMVTDALEMIANNGFDILARASAELDSDHPFFSLLMPAQIILVEEADRLQVKLDSPEFTLNSF